MDVYDIHIVNPKMEMILDILKGGGAVDASNNPDLNFDVLGEIMKHTDIVTKALVNCTCTNLKVHTVSQYDAMTYLANQLRSELNDTDAKIVITHTATNSFTADAVISISSSGIWMSPNVKSYLDNWANNKSVISYRFHGDKQHLNVENIKKTFGKLFQLDPKKLKTTFPVEQANQLATIDQDVTNNNRVAPVLAINPNQRGSTFQKDSGFYLPTSIVKSMMKNGDNDATILIAIRQNDNANVEYRELMKHIRFEKSTPITQSGGKKRSVKAEKTKPSKPPASKTIQSKKKK